MKHLITGGSGFIGDKIARRLIERGAVASAMWWRATTLTCIRQRQASMTQHRRIARR